VTCVAVAVAFYLVGVVTGRAYRRRPQQAIQLVHVVEPTQEWRQLELPAVRRKQSIPTVH
jgi:hypothetical protein